MRRVSAQSRPFGILLAVALVLAILVPAPASAEVIDIPVSVEGCLATTGVGVGMHNNIVDPGVVSLDLPGSVEAAIVEWTGKFEVATPAAADQTLGVEITGPGGTNGNAAVVPEFTASDSAVADPAGFPQVVTYASVITDLFGDGAAGSYTIDITPPTDPIDAGTSTWWGATVTVAYDTSPCDQVSEIKWKIGADWYFGGGGPLGVESTTETVTYLFDEPFAEDTLVTLQTSHGGADSDSPRANGQCRVSVMWVATGAGTAPTAADDLVFDDGTVNPAYGASQGVIDPFTPPNQTACGPVVVNDPVQAVRGGHVGPEWAVIETDILMTAGSTWLAIQLESPRDNNGFPTLPESGTWSGGGILIFTPNQAPAIALEKTVLDGAGAACPGVEGTDEIVAGVTGTAVTYCFRVENTGDTDLFPVVIDDPDLGITQADMTLVSGDDTVPLPPGGVLVYSYDSTITADLLNTATVTGTPVDEEGPIPGLEDVTDTNDAQVVILGVAPAIALEKTVLDGAGAACPGVEGTDEIVAGVTGTAVTYCFRVENTGDTDLFPVVIDDPDLGITQADMTLVSGDDTVPLPPGGVLVYSYDSTITADLLNTATVTGTPVDEEGPIPGVGDVTDTNDAQVIEGPTGGVDPAPDVELEKTVLDGAGAACPGVEGTDEIVAGVTGTAVTYCFRVENTGDTDLFPVVIDDPDLGITQADMTLVSGDDTVPLPPGGVLVYSYDSTITADLLNTATVTGTPVDEEGPIPGVGDVTDTNDAVVIEGGTGQVDPELPATGAHSDRLAKFGLILLLAGAGLVIAGRTAGTGKVD